ncbi:MAG: GTP 3',8-cyclase MoaA [Eubacteriales bacterium]|nr:GTP 3',8-cyclase MoaA [Eubacteriales bacterium]
MIDQFGRSVTYLRVSVTELCNLRCRYCMPAEGVCKKNHADMLTEDEMIQAIEAAASLGITKLRITGGEPLVKKNIVSICRRAAAVPGIEEVCLTTNGIFLPRLAKPLREAGVRRLNLSLDTLDPEKYAYITRIGSLGDFWKGFHAALDAGFEKIKLNAVLVGGFNDDEIVALAELTKQYPVDMRFIEMMPMCDSAEFGEDAYIPFTRVLEALPEAQPVPKDGGVAKLYRLPGGKGNIGLISPVSAHFCGDCNRIRLTADGKVKPCLHSNAEYPLKGLDFDGMRTQLEKAIWNKPKWHGDLDAAHHSGAGRNMNQIGG